MEDNLGLHFLDIYHKSYCGTRTHWQGSESDQYERRTPCAVVLSEAGIKFKKSDTDNIHDIDFQNGVLTTSGWGSTSSPAARRVSPGWKAEVESPFHHRLRQPRPLLALAQARPPLVDSGPARKYAASAGYSYRLVLHDLAAGTWTPLPDFPGARGSGGLPLFCQLAAVGEGPSTKLMVLGGWDPETWAPTAAVHVYDFLSGVWRRGADMPPPRRSFFACAAVGGRVFVAGGHDAEKNALRSAAAYDAEADAWTALPDMARERDEARGVRAAGGRFVALGGYPTEAQGRFGGSAEAFDPATWSWGPVRERVIEDGACPRTCCAAAAAAGNGMMYMLDGGRVMARDDDDDEGGAWRTVARVPEDGRAVATEVVDIGDGRVAVIGCACHGSASMQPCTALSIYRSAVASRHNGPAVGPVHPSESTA